MANCYVYSGAAGTGTGADWTNAYTSLNAALNASHSAGDVVWVADDHNETAAGTIVSAPALMSILCVVRVGGSVPPALPADLRKTAVVQTAGGTSLTIFGFLNVVYGMIFKAGVANAVATNMSLGTNSSADTVWRSCQFWLNNTATSSSISIGAGNMTRNVFDDCSFKFLATAANVNVRPNGRIIWKNSVALVSGSSVPTAFFSSLSSICNWLIENCDLSALTAIFPNMTSGVFENITIKNCKLNASVSIMGTSIGPEINVIGCDSGTKFYRDEKTGWCGKFTSDSTTIYRTGGASFGSTTYSWKVDTNGNTLFTKPFELPPITVWVSAGSHTMTLHGAWSGASPPTNAEMCVELAYLSSSSSPQGTTLTTDPIVQGVTATAFSSGASWNGSPTSTFSIVMTFTSLQDGPITIYPKFYKPSTTFYIDPKPVIT